MGPIRNLWTTKQTILKILTLILKRFKCKNQNSLNWMILKAIQWVSIAFYKTFQTSLNPQTVDLTSSTSNQCTETISCHLKDSWTLKICHTTHITATVFHPTTLSNLKWQWTSIWTCTRTWWTSTWAQFLLTQMRLKLCNRTIKLNSSSTMTFLLETSVRHRKRKILRWKSLWIRKMSKRAVKINHGSMIGCDLLVPFCL